MIYICELLSLQQEGALGYLACHSAHLWWLMRHGMAVALSAARTDTAHADAAPTATGGALGERGRLGRLG